MIIYQRMSIFNPIKYLKYTAAVLAVFSIVLIFFPAYVLLFFKDAQAGAAVMFMRFLGASLAGHSYMNWEVGRYEPSALRPVYLMNIIALVLAVFIDMWAIYKDMFTVLGILIFVMHVVFLLGFLIIYRHIPRVTA